MKQVYTLEELSTKQVELEIGMKTAGIERFHKNNERSIDNGSNSETQWNRRIIQELVDPMSKAIEAYVDYYTGRPGKPSIVLKYIQTVTPQQASYIAIKNILDSLTRQTELITVSEAIGRRIEDQVRFSKLADSAPKYIEKVYDNLKRARSQSYSHKRKVLAHAENTLSSADTDKFEPVSSWKEWDKKHIIQVGAKLVDIFMENVLFEGEPVVKKETKSQMTNGKPNMKSFLSPTERIEEWVTQYKEIMEVLSPVFAPCVIPPVDWTTPYNGGYHIPEVSDTLPMVKGRKSQVRRLTKKQMPLVYDAVNHLQSTPWQVSDKVLDVALEVMDRDLAMGIPSSEPMKPEAAPLPEHILKLRGKEMSDAMTQEQKDSFLDWKREATMIYNMDKKRAAKYMQAHRTVMSAKKYAEFEAIYFVYTLDSRGRVYCKSDSVNPQGDDLQKGLIRFSEGKALGETGRYWLAIHGANVYGNDKLSFDDRAAFIDSLCDTIQDIAIDPLTYTEWAGTDKPWQFLNWCMEWAALLEWEEDGNDTKDFISHIPCGMDGSCSGIQHYSAILRDPIGGAAVNLVPDSLPHDIYGDIAKVVEAKMKEDQLTAEDEDDKKAASGWLRIKDGINRKLTKSPAMTITYGSTQMRCNDTTGNYLVELQDKENKQAIAENRDPSSVHPFIKEHGGQEAPLFKAINYGSKTIWKSIGEVVTAAKDGMYFIQQVAKEVAKAGSHLEWITPSGFIVEQLELEYTTKRVDTQIQGMTRFTIAEETDKVNVRKMRTSSAPNFVHSMDATHLVMLTNAAKAKGFSMACIHDDFGTHAGNTEELRKILVDTLADLYLENDVLQDFKDHNEGLISQEIEAEVPGHMGLDLNEIRRSTYCFA
jgi:DNA-directed RNA polymerase, mitochondrial